MDANTLVFFWGKKTRFSIRVDFSELYTIRKKHIFQKFHHRWTIKKVI